MNVQARDASTVVLMRDGNTGGPEILLVKRNSKADFAAGVYVFPGGMLETADAEMEECLSGVEEALAQIPEGLTREKFIGLMVAAIRETFEEAGILLAEAYSGAPLAEGIEKIEAFRESRKKLIDGSLSFKDFLVKHNLRLPLNKLVYLAHWITPEGQPKRFDTRFFLIGVSAGTEAVTDNQEVSLPVWLTPQAALEARESGDLGMMPPTYKNIERLKDYASVEEALAEEKLKKVPEILPKMKTVQGGGFEIILPSDPEYSTL